MEVLVRASGAVPRRCSDVDRARNAVEGRLLAANEAGWGLKGSAEGGRGAVLGCQWALRLSITHIFSQRRGPIPKGLHRSAQGCEARATLG